MPSGLQNSGNTVARDHASKPRHEGKCETQFGRSPRGYPSPDAARGKIWVAGYFLIDPGVPRYWLGKRHISEAIAVNYAKNDGLVQCRGGHR